MMRSKLLITGGIFLALTLSGFLMLKKESPSRFLETRVEFVMREIGHKVLLHAGDSSSRVMPVKRLSRNAFQLEFQNEFTFMPDTLATIVHTSLAARELPLRYTVSVRDCRSNEMIYGYEMDTIKNTTIACLGRVQPVGCYTIQVIFLEPEVSGISGTHYVAGITLLGLVLIGFVFFNTRKMHGEPTDQYVNIREYTFHAGKRTLKRRNATVLLTHKEAKVLSVLTANMNQPVDREQLLKEVWEDEGVIVGRSLDVFISKLRKKFMEDPAIRIVNIHGNGYKLEVD